MAFTDHVKVLFGADTKDFNKELELAEAKTKKFASNFKTYFVGALGTAAIAKTTTEVVDFASKIENMAKRLGVTTDFLQAFQYGAEQSGIKSDAAGIALQRFTRRIQEAKEKGGPLRDTLREIGIEFKNNNGTYKSTQELFKEFGDTLANMESPAKKLRTAFQFLDTEGAALVQMFQKGGKSIDDYGAEAKRLGILLEADTITKFREAGDTLEKLKRQFLVTAAQFLPPLIDTLKALGERISKVMTTLSKFSGEILSLVGVIAAWKTASIAFTAVAPIIAGLNGIRNAIMGTTVAIQAMNTAAKANIFGLIIAGVTALGFALANLFGDTNKATEAMNQMAQAAKQKHADAMEEFALKIKGARTELIEITKELDKLKEKQIELTPKEQLEKLKDVRKELQGRQKELQKEIELAERHAGIQAQLLQAAKDRNDTAELINKREIGVQHFNEKALVLKKQLAQIEIDILKNAEAIIPVEKEAKNLFQARVMGLKHILEKRTDEEKALERSLEKAKALAANDQEQLKFLEKKYEFEDLTAKLIKDRNLSVRDAVKLAKELLEAQENEEKLRDANKQHAEAIKKADEDRRDKAEKTVAELKKQKDLLAEITQKQNEAKKEAQLRLDVLKLMVAGRDDEARKLQEKIKAEKEILRVMKEQGVNAKDARDQLGKEVVLENKLAFKKKEEEVQEIKNQAVQEMGLKKRKDLITNQDRRRASAARRIEGLEKKITAEMKRGGDRADKEIKRLNDLKEKEFKILLDDDTKKKIQELQAEKQDILNANQIQLGALKAAAEEAQAAQQKANEAVAAAAIEIAAKGEEQKGKVNEVIDAGAEAIKAVGDKTVAEIAKIKNPEIELNQDDVVAAINALSGSLNDTISSMGSTGAGAMAPVINVNPPMVLNNIKVELESELKQQTQEDILETLKGYFVNQ